MITRTSGKLLYKYIFYIMTSQLCTYILGKVSKLKSQGQKGEDTEGTDISFRSTYIPQSGS